jgi:hypothetical protein
MRNLWDLRTAGAMTLMALLVVACADSSWEAVRNKNTVAAYHQFLRDKPDSEHAGEARERLEYLRVSTHPTIGAYEGFRQDYPTSPLIAELKSQLEPLFFAVARQANTPEAYRHFASLYPNGQLLGRAMGNLAYVETVRAAPTAVALRGFIETHVDSDFVAEAQQTLELLESRRQTSIRKLGVRVDVAPNVMQPERVRKGFASVVARAYRDAGIQIMLLEAGDGPPQDADGWVRVDYHEAPASGVFGGGTLLSHARVRVYHRDTERAIWDRSFHAPADHVLKGAYGRDKTVFGNSKYRFWEEFFVPVSTWAVSGTRVGRMNYLEDLEAIDIRGDRAALLLERGGVDFVDISAPLEPKIDYRYRRESDLSNWAGVRILDEELTLIYGGTGAELIRLTELAPERIGLWEVSEVGGVRGGVRFDQNTVLLATSTGVFALRIGRTPFSAHRLLDGEYVGIEIHGEYIFLTRPDRVEVATPKHLLRHMTGSRTALGKSFAASRAVLRGSSLFVFGKGGIAQISLQNPERPKVVALLSPDELGPVSDVAMDASHLYLLGGRGLQIAGPGGKWVADSIQVDAITRLELNGRFAFLVGGRSLEVLDLGPYHSTAAASPAP